MLEKWHFVRVSAKIISPPPPPPPLPPPIPQLEQPHALYLDTELKQRTGRCGTGGRSLA